MQLLESWQRSKWMPQEAADLDWRQYSYSAGLVQCEIGFILASIFAILVGSKTIPTRSAAIAITVMPPYFCVLELSKRVSESSEPQ